jgi:hypothetical protein
MAKTDKDKAVIRNASDSDGIGFVGLKMQEL